MVDVVSMVAGPGSYAREGLAEVGLAVVELVHRGLALGHAAARHGAVAAVAEGTLVLLLARWACLKGLESDKRG